MTTSPIKAFIFDWAGTMIDFGCCAPVEALQEAFTEIGLTLSDSEARADMGMAKRAHIEAILFREPLASTFFDLNGRTPIDTDVDDLFWRVEPKMIEAAARRTVLIEGAAALVETLRGKGIKIGSGTGYSRSMMDEILKAAAHQGYSPDCVVCAGETAFGRPSPLMSYKAMLDLGVYPARACVKVDDAIVGITEGLEAGLWTIGLAASGNGVGLRHDEFKALSHDERQKRVQISANALINAGAHYVVDSVADIEALLPEIEDLISHNIKPSDKKPQLRLKMNELCS